MKLLPRSQPIFALKAYAPAESIQLPDAQLHPAPQAVAMTVAPLAVVPAVRAATPAVSANVTGGARSIQPAKTRPVAGAGKTPRAVSAIVPVAAKVPVVAALFVIKLQTSV